jgi:hypothetical protein
VLLHRPVDLRDDGAERPGLDTVGEQRLLLKDARGLLEAFREGASDDVKAATNRVF